jgi:hypothetical protein
MRKLNFIWIVLSALMLAGACSRLEEQNAALNIYVRLPEDVTTKAFTNSDWATLFNRETRINDLKIWVFLNESTDQSLPAGKLLGYLEPKQLNVASGKVQKFTVLLDKEIASKIKKVDVYVLANSRAIQLQEIGKTTTSAELEALTLSGNRFGITDNGTPTNTSVVDYEGLPYTAMGKGLTLSGSATNLSVENETLQLVRAVSKIQFVFSQIMLASGDKPVPFTITGLELDGGQIPEQEYLFKESSVPYRIGSDYVLRTLNFPNLPTKDDIAGNTNPSSYAFNSSAGTSQEYQEYQDKIYDALVNGRLTGYAPCYLRESDKALKGRIRYTVGNSTEKTLEFSMITGEKFKRNSSWVLYFYINNNALSLSVSYADWTSDGSYTIIGR